MTPPVLTDDQRAQARASAIQARRERAEVRRSLRAGDVGIDEILASDVASYRRMRVREVLQALPSLGPVRSAQIMSTVGIAPTRRIQGLSTRQREELIALVDGRIRERAL